MSKATHDLFDASPDWRIVMAAPDVAHIFIPLTKFTFTPETDSVNGQVRFRLKYACQRPDPDAFNGTSLAKMGKDTPTFQDVVQDFGVFKSVKQPLLPVYDGSDDVIVKYEAVADAMQMFLTGNPDVQRIEGTIRVPCHPHGAEIKNPYLKLHTPLLIKTLVQVFQFPNALQTGDPLLVIRTPLSPACPMNGDGTALGISR